LAHAAAPHGFDDAVMRNGLADHLWVRQEVAPLNRKQLAASLQAAKTRKWLCYVIPSSLEPIGIGSGSGSGSGSLLDTKAAVRMRGQRNATREIQGWS
jgi:hypothetical protein